VEFDKETQQTLLDGQRIEDFVKSPAWGLIKMKLTNKIMDLQSIMNVDPTNPEQAILDLKARMMCVSTLLEWLREVEGAAEQHSTNQTIINEEYLIQI